MIESITVMQRQVSLPFRRFTNRAVAINVGAVGAAAGGSSSRAVWTGNPDWAIFNRPRPADEESLVKDMDPRRRRIGHGHFGHTGTSGGTDGPWYIFGAVALTVVYNILTSDGNREGPNKIKPNRFEA
jgi:hypothetical protein